MSANRNSTLMGQQLQSMLQPARVAHSEPVIDLHCLGDDIHCAEKPMIFETAWPLIVNGEHWLTVICTPTKLDYFVLGFLYNEGLITNPDDVLDLQIGPPSEQVIRVELRDRNLKLPQRRTLTSGCGGGITFVDLAAARESIQSSLRVTPQQISDQMIHLMTIVADDHRRIGGFHTTGLSDRYELLVTATDIGRHNTLDKITGECLANNISMQDTILLTTGRISVEMLGKAARMQVPVVATLNSPTHLAVELAREWGITLIGYARGTKIHVYTCWQRLALQDSIVPYSLRISTRTELDAGSNGKDN
jgi:FdhD protein